MGIKDVERCFRVNSESGMAEIYLLDYGAGNVRSLVNAVSSLGFQLKRIESPSDFQKADVILLEITDNGTMSLILNGHN
jgi:hypothetical protein